MTYDLYRGTVLQVSLPGTGSPLKFLVTTDGNYTIKATRGDVSRNMNGSARVSYYGVLEGKIVVSASPRVMLSKDGETKMIPFSLGFGLSSRESGTRRDHAFGSGGGMCNVGFYICLGIYYSRVSYRGTGCVGCGPNW